MIKRASSSARCMVFGFKGQECLKESSEFRNGWMGCWEIMNGKEREKTEAALFDEDGRLKQKMMLLEAFQRKNDCSLACLPHLFTTFALGFHTRGVIFKDDINN